MALTTRKCNENDRKQLTTYITGFTVCYFVHFCIV